MIVRNFVYPVARNLGFPLIRYPAFGRWIYISPRSVLLRRLAQEGAYEQQNIEILKALLPRNGCLYDIGANFGIISLAIATARSDCTILSVEPSHICVAGLTLTLEEASQSNWQLVRCAVGDHNGQVELITSASGEDAFGGLGDTGRMAGLCTRESVPIKTLDTLWKERGCEQVSVIKIDVEGFELDVLRGATALLGSCQPHLLIEISRLNLLALGKSADHIFRFADKHDYELWNAETMTKVPSAKALGYQIIVFENYLLTPRQTT